VGKYVVGERMAKGGMAEVFHAEAESGAGFGGPIVVKQMRRELAASKEMVAMFVEEARISTRLDHPNIVKVHDFEATDHGLSLVMELVDGPDLLAVLRRCAKVGRPFDPELAVYVACHVLEALDYAHAAASPTGERLNVIHRDVSPSNILITRRGHVKLADFGIARMTYGRTSELASGTLKGKFGYMSPEQVRGDELDARSDVFSLGVVLAEMLMMRRLFSAASDVDLLLMVRRADVSRLERYGAHVPPALQHILRTALAAEPARRFATAGAFRDELAEWLASSNRRTGAGRLSELIRVLEEDGGELCAWGQTQTSASATMAGTETRIARRAASEAAELGRIALVRARSPSPATEPVMLAPFHAMTPARGPAGGIASSGGALEQGTVIDAFCEVVRTKGSGLLTLRSGSLVKEAYFADGHPVFVASNVPEDRFGEFLVRRQILTRDQVDRALSVLDHFEGRLGTALVSLGLLHPIEAVRLLGAQVANKLIDACAWTKGTYELTEGAANPWPALALGLRSEPIIGRSLGGVSIERLEGWLHHVRNRRTRLDVAAAEAFDFEPGVMANLRPLENGVLDRALDRLSSATARWHLTAAAYVLWRCGELELL
jgi:serine/threonine-protein kinase